MNRRQTYAVTLTEAERDFLLTLLGTTDYDESYHNELGFNFPTGVIRNADDAIRNAVLS